MTIGRSNSSASETRSMVSWKVERGPNSGRNCFGRPSRDDGQSRVPAPPHMISGMISLSIRPSILLPSDAVMLPIPRDKIANAVFDCRFRLEAHVAHQIIHICERGQDVTGLHG